MPRLLAVPILSLSLCLGAACYVEEEEADVAATPTVAQPHETDTPVPEPVATPLPLAATAVPESAGSAAKGGGGLATSGGYGGPANLTYPTGPYHYPYPPYPYPTPRPCLDDSLEHNDTPGTAWPVTLPFSAARLRVCPWDDDLFAFPLTRGETVRLEATFSHAEGNIDIALVNPEGMPVASGFTRTDNETLTYTCCGAAGIGLYAAHVNLAQDDGPLVGNSYDLDISSVLPTPCAPEGCPTPTVTPTPFPSLDFSVGVDTDGDTTDDCGTRAGDAGWCFVPSGGAFAVKTYLNGLPPDVPSYEGFDIVLTYSGFGSKNDAATDVWPDCVFQAAHYKPGLLAFGCAAVHPTAYIGLIGTIDFNCPSTPTTGTITMRHGPGNTALAETVGATHYEGIDATESLSINCVEAPPAPGPGATATPTPSPGSAPPPPSPTSGGGGAALDMGGGLNWIGRVLVGS